MGYMNFVAYFQREIGNIFHNVRVWAWANIDNIIYKAKSLSNFLQKLRILFEIFLKYNISIKSTKSYLNYFDDNLLDQQVNFLDLAIFVEKLKAIRLLNYSNTLGVLKYHLELTSYLRNYIYFYALLVAFFQTFKTFLLYNAPISS